MELILLAIGAFVVFSVVQKMQSNGQRDRWRNWHIDDYKISLRYDARSLNLDGDVLGEMTTLTVVDGEIVSVTGTHASISTIEEYERFTIEGLFEMTIYYATVQYDSVYGFPTRLGDTNHWVIEVVSFEPLG
jgi:hypothetical protein